MEEYHMEAYFHERFGQNNKRRIRIDKTRRQYMSKPEAFFDFIELKGSIDEQACKFVIVVTKELDTALSWLMRFISFQKERVARREITEATLRIYYKPIKLFCEMNDIQVSWKKLAKGMPRVSRASNDGASTLKEIKRLAQYPDRRIRPGFSICKSSIGITIHHIQHRSNGFSFHS